MTTTYEQKLAHYRATKRPGRPKLQLDPNYIIVGRSDLERVLYALIEETPDSLKQAETFISKYLKTNQLSNVPANTSAPGA